MTFFPIPGEPDLHSVFVDTLFDRALSLPVVIYVSFSFARFLSQIFDLLKYRIRTDWGRSTSVWKPPKRYGIFTRFSVFNVKTRYFNKFF